jgi:predicted nucleotidyltransferase component of viral defense system
MKTLRRRIQDARKAGGVDQLVIERDYAQSYVLYGLGQTAELRSALVFKGGTALRKVHFGHYRFSEDRLEEICAEKLRATQQTLAKLKDRGWTRSRARDYYDLWHLAREPDGRIDWEQVSSIVGEKCRLRDVQITAVEDIFDGRLLEEIRRTWDRTLGPFVAHLPAVDIVVNELRGRLAAFLRF